MFKTNKKNYHILAADVDTSWGKFLFEIDIVGYPRFPLKRKLGRAFYCSVGNLTHEQIMWFSETFAIYEFKVKLTSLMHHPHPHGLGPPPWHGPCRSEASTHLLGRHTSEIIKASFRFSTFLKIIVLISIFSQWSIMHTWPNCYNLRPRMETVFILL